MTQRILQFLLLAAMLVLVSPARADFKQDYLNAVKAFNKGDYQDAINDLRSAIADNPEANAAVRFYGMRREPYLPYFYLGNALYQVGDCTGAMQAWQTAQQLGVADQAGEGATLQSNMANCAGQVVDLSEFVAQANNDIEALRAAVQTFSNLRDEALLADSWSNRWAPEQAKTETLIGSLQNDLAAADSAMDKDAIQAVSSSARQELTRINGVRDLAMATVRDLQANQAERLAAQREQAQRELRQAIASAGTVQLPSGANASMQNLKKDLETQLQRAQAAGTDASAGNLRELAQGISGTLRRYQQAEQSWRAEQQSIADRTPPPELKVIAEAYFAGDYQAVSRNADPDRFNEPRPRVQSLLFRAAASYKLYVLSGEKERSLLSQAQADIRAIKQINSDFSPYIAAFSPSFIELFRQTG